MVIISAPIYLAMKFIDSLCLCGGQYTLSAAKVIVLNSIFSPEKNYALFPTRVGQ
jgi:hypothetical protein